MFCPMSVDFTRECRYKIGFLPLGTREYRSSKKNTAASHSIGQLIKSGFIVCILNNVLHLSILKPATLMISRLSSKNIV